LLDKKKPEHPGLYGKDKKFDFFWRFSNSILEFAPEILNPRNSHCTASFEGKRFLLQGLKLFVERWAARCHEDL